MNYRIHYREGQTEYFEDFDIEIRGRLMRLYQLDENSNITTAQSVYMDDVLYIEPEV